MPRDKGFGHLKPVPDGRNFKYLAASAMVQMQARGVPAPRRRPYNEGPILDQGQYPHCVGYSAKGFLNAAPLMSKPETEPSAQLLYKMAQQRDEWPGTNYDGSSVNGGCKAMRDLGLIENYVWFTNQQHAIDWCNGGYGTIIVGTYWYAAMDNLDRDGFMQEPHSMSSPLGGHAYRLNWFDTKVGTKGRKGWRVINSWGTDVWGIEKKDGTTTGTAFMSAELMDRLCFREDGEVAAPTQVRVVPINL